MNDALRHPDQNKHNQTHIECCNASTSLTLVVDEACHLPLNQLFLKSLYARIYVYFYLYLAVYLTNPQVCSKRP